MLQTACALFLAHVLADFVFQTKGMIATKARPEIQLLHAGIVLGLSLMLLGTVTAAEVWLLAVLHLFIDAVKVMATRGGLWPFLADQAAHLALIAGLAAIRPDLWAEGIWPRLLPVTLAETAPMVMLVTGGAIFAMRAGGFAVGLLMAGIASRGGTALAEGIPGAGAVIGILERGLIYGLILLGQAEAVGFLIAAKSILRFGTVKEDRAASEYVIIGTLASFGWAILSAFAVQGLLGGLEPVPVRP